MGKGNDPRYNSLAAFEPFPFPTGLTPADTAHQQTEQVEGGALIPALVPCADGLRIESAMTTQGTALGVRDDQPREAGVGQVSGAISKSEAYEPPASAPPPPSGRQQRTSVRVIAIEIAKAAKKLNDLKALQKRTLTNLYNLRPQWLVMAHQQLDLAVAQAYGWSDYSADMADEEILKRLLALNLARSGDEHQ